MQVKEVMTKGLESVEPSDTLYKAAEKMKRLNVGSLPVLRGEDPIGIITDRDIVVRAIAEHKDPEQIKVSEILTEDPVTCDEDTELEEALRLMSERKIRRLIVKDMQGKPSGIVSLGDLASHAKTSQAGEAIRQVSTPSQPAR